MNKQVLIGVGIGLLVVLVVGGSFFAGTLVGESRARQGLFQGRFGGQGGQFQRQGQPPGGRPGGGIMGTIKSAQGDTLVLTTSQGDTQVQTTNATVVEKYTTASVGDLKVGERVVVSGTQNDDGSLTAQSIQSLRDFEAPRPQ